MGSFIDILKATGKTDKDTRHTYGHVYDWVFAPHRNTRINILEVGVCLFGGGCILSLQEYFPLAEVYGVDIDTNSCCPECFSRPRLTLVNADAYDEDQMAVVLRGLRFQIIIDDGSHEIEAQIKLLQFLSGYMSEGGIYCIEDCVTEQWLPRLRELHALGLQQTIIDMATEEQPDNTIVLWKRA